MPYPYIKAYPHVNNAAQSAVNEVQAMVWRVVTDHLALGTAGALGAAADIFLMSSRRVRGYYHHEIRAVLPNELAGVRVAELERHEASLAMAA